MLEEVALAFEWVCGMAYVISMDILKVRASSVVRDKFPTITASILFDEEEVLSFIDILTCPTLPRRMLAGVSLHVSLLLEPLAALFTFMRLSRLMIPVNGSVQDNAYNKLLTVVRLEFRTRVAPCSKSRTQGG